MLFGLEVGKSFRPKFGFHPKRRRGKWISKRLSYTPQWLMYLQREPVYDHFYEALLQP